MILPPFFIPKIMKNTSGNGPETIPVFRHLFSPFLMIFDLLLGALFGAKREFALLFWRTFFRLLPPVSFFSGGSRHFRRSGEFRPHFSPFRSYFTSPNIAFPTGAYKITRPAKNHRFRLRTLFSLFLMISTSFLEPFLGKNGTIS